MGWSYNDMSEQIVNILRWHDEEMSPCEFPELLKIVADATDLSLRRNNNHISISVQDIQSKLEMIGYHAKRVLERISWCQTFLPHQLDKLSKDRKNIPIRIISNTLNSDRRVEFYDYIIVLHIEYMLVQSKALLDSLSQFYSYTFERKKITSFYNRGNNLLKDMNNLPKGLNTYKEAIKNLILESKKCWINQVIKYRDEVVHHGQLRKFRCPMLRLTDSLHYRPEDVAPACMPDGRDIKLFIDMVVNESHTFTASFLEIIFRRLRDQAEPT